MLDRGLITKRADSLVVSWVPLAESMGGGGGGFESIQPTKRVSECFDNWGAPLVHKPTLDSIVLFLLLLHLAYGSTKKTHNEREREIPQQQQGHEESRLQHTLPTGTLQEKRRKRYPLRELFPTETPHPNAVVTSTNRQKHENQRLAPQPKNGFWCSRRSCLVSLVAGCGIRVR